MPTDFIGLFTLLAAARIRFVVVGGLALLLHGLDRPTADVDLAIDLSTHATQDAVVVRISDMGVRIASIPHLIKMKEAAGRAQDLADLERLRAKLMD
jgi:hypothetical protein